MAKPTVQSEDLRNQSAAIKAGSADVNDTFTRLTSQITDPVAGWEGAPSQAFQTRGQEWQTGAQSGGVVHNVL